MYCSEYGRPRPVRCCSMINAMRASPSGANRRGLGARWKLSTLHCYFAVAGHRKETRRVGNAREH
jgi:hypothetical protein